ncbi:MAG: PVC-type heme-binding CxxCH protein [Verrucomicrobiales bacterium]
MTFKSSFHSSWPDLILSGTLLLGSAMSGLAAESPDSEHHPKTELASFKVADGFNVNLFASEADGVVKPIQIRFDSAGRVWVIGSSVYPQVKPGEVPNDKVLILEDTDGDGVSDKTSVFADGLMIPTGIELGDGGAYVGHGTELLHLRDTDGDGKADERRVVMRGFGTGDNHQNINSFLWGPGGELWMSQGLHTYSNVETPFGIIRLHQAGIWRFRPQLSKLEPFYGSAHEPQNPWGFLFTDWGEPIVLAGNNSSPIYPVSGLVPNRREAAPVLIHKNGRGRKVSGGDIVGTRHFPDDWQGLVVTGGYINNSVWALKLSDDGAGFVLEDVPPLIQSTSRNFRPVDVKFAPDGSLYICDWYNPIIGHYQESFRHPNRDKEHGRIWRVTAKNRPLTKNPELHKKSAAEILGLLGSDDRWTRQFSKRALANLPHAEVEKALGEHVATNRLSELELKELLGISQIIGKVNTTIAERLTRAKHAGARGYAAYVIGLWAEQFSNGLELLAPLAVDPEPRVRLQAIVAASYFHSARAMEVALRAADLPRDQFIDYALGQVTHSLKPHWLPEFRTGNLDFENQASRLSLLIRADGTADVLEAVRAGLKSKTLQSAVRESYLQTLADHGDSRDLLVIFEEPPGSARTKAMDRMAISVKARNLPASEEAGLALQAIIAEPHVESKSAAYKLAGAWKLSSAYPVMEKVVGNRELSLDERRAAFEGLGLAGEKSFQPLLKAVAVESAKRQDEDFIVSAAIGAMAKIDIKAAAGLLAELLPTIKEQKAYEEMFVQVVSREGGSELLASAFRKNPPAGHFALVGLTIINSTGRRNAELAALLEKVNGVQPTLSEMKDGQLSRFVAEVKTSGNNQRGKQIYERIELGCVACHQVNGNGGKLGPDLSSLGSAQPIDFIVRAILDPQKEIKEGFTSVSIITKEGESLQGYLVRETKDEVAIRDPLQSKEIRVHRESIKELKPNDSLMPAGLVDGLHPVEFRDLVSYLSELGANK